MNKISAATKIVLTIVLIVIVIKVSSAFILFGILVLTIFLSVVFKVDLQNMFSSILTTRYFILSIILLNLLFFNQENAFAKFWIFSPSYEGLLQGLTSVLRLLIIVIVTSSLMSSTPPIELMNAFAFLLKPLSLIGLPVSIVSLIISITLRFIPILAEEIETIKKAQIARGAKFNSPHFFERGKSFLPLLVPIFISAFKRADDLSLAMEARGFNPKTKRSAKVMVKLNYLDYMILCICIIGIAFVILV